MLEALTGNRALCAALMAWGVAQMIKTLIASLHSRRFLPQMLLASGGMPSSHAALVCGLATAIGRVTGIGSPSFAVAVVLAGIVMYDACGVRLAAGHHAQILNRLLARDRAEPGVSSRLSESIGHTPFEVLAGALLGIAIGMFATR